MAFVAVVTNTEKPLMPTSPYRARKLLASGRAKIYSHRPFAIMLLDRADGEVQEIEYKSDTGYLHVGISVCSRKQEYIREQRNLLPDETEKHADQKSKRRNRRNRKRYREPRFDNRVGKIHKAEKDGDVWLAPSLRHKVEAQVALFLKFCKVMPITDAYFEMGKFNPVYMKALEKGEPVPEGKDYQRGEQYQIATRRAAVFARDHHTCVFCGRGIKEQAYLHVHHSGYWKGDHSNRLGNLVTCCEQCHTPENHQPGGKLYGQEPKVSNMASAAFMNTVRYELLRQIKKAAPDVRIHTCYGVETSQRRRQRALPKSHTNDAYCLGKFFPKHRVEEEVYQKVRRNDRILQKFYDASYIDLRDGKVKKGKELTNGRINRNRKKDHENLRPFRGRKVSKGKVSIRRGRPQIKPGSLVEVNGEILQVHGTHRKDRKLKNGTISTSINVEFTSPARGGKKSASLRKCKLIKPSYNTGWIKM